MSALRQQGRPTLYRRIGLLCALAVLLPTAAAMAVAETSGGSWADGLRWLLYMVAFAGVSALLGLVFGVPRARTEYAADPDERYSSNSNLEQISDWLTKLLVGAGLVQIGRAPEGLRALSDYMAEDLTLVGARAYSLTSALYGVGLGFLVGYLWTRLRLRLLLETSDREAAEASERKEIFEGLREASAAQEEPATSEELWRTTDAALRGSAHAAIRRVLWVDDHPENNARIVRTLQDLGIRVDLAQSTAEGLERLGQADYGVLISDLGRKEGDEDVVMAGRDLVQGARSQGFRRTIIVFAGWRGVRSRSSLLEAGADVVTNRVTELVEAVVAGLNASA